MIRDFKDRQPKIHESAYIDPQCSIIGDVNIDRDCSVWPGASLRGDMNSISIHRGTNIQDNASVHTRLDNTVSIGVDVTVGHNAVIHGAHIGNNTLIGMGAIVLDDAVIGNNCIIGAGALVPPGKKIPDGSLAIGMPAKVVRKLDEEEIKAISENSQDYITLKESYTV